MLKNSPHTTLTASSQKLSRAGPRQFLDGGSPQNSSFQLLRRMLSVMCSWQPHGRGSKWTVSAAMGQADRHHMCET